MLNIKAIAHDGIQELNEGGNSNFATSWKIAMHDYSGRSYNSRAQRELVPLGQHFIRAVILPLHFDCQETGTGQIWACISDELKQLIDSGNPGWA